MQIMLRDRELGELIPELHGKRVLVWTCNTCARMCDVGGKSNADRLAEVLSSEGVEVVGSVSVGASCLFSSAEEGLNGSERGFDIVLALTCDIGSRVVGELSGRSVVNPVRTLGTGYRDGDRMPVMMDRGSGRETTLSELASDQNLPLGPFSK